MEIYNHKKDIFSQIINMELNNAINLSLGEPHFDVHPDIIDTIIKCLKNGKTKYCDPQGLEELRQKYIQAYRSDFLYTYSPENVFVGAGVSNILNLLFSIFLNKNDSVIVITPYYFSYKHLLDHYGVKIIYVNEKFTVNDLEIIEGNIKMIIFSNPSNPTGYCFTIQQLKLLIEYSKQKDILIISDEIYRDFDYDGKYNSIAQYSKQAIILRGFSKSHAMTGLRLGLAIAPKEIIKKLVDFHTHSYICVPEAIQKGGIAALDIDVTPFKQYYNKNRMLIFNTLQKFMDVSIPSGGFYFFLTINKEDIEFVNSSYVKHNILLCPGYEFINSHNYVRISFCTSIDIINKFILQLPAIFN